MKYECWYTHENHYWNGSWSMSTDNFVVKAKNKEKAEKKANKKIYKYNKKYVGDFQLNSVDEIKKK